MNNKKNSEFFRTIEEDGSIRTEFKNDVYNFINVDDMHSANTDIELKQTDTGEIITQLISDLSYTNNKLNRFMGILEHLSIQGVIPNEIVESLEKGLNTIDNRAVKQK